MRQSATTQWVRWGLAVIVWVGLWMHPSTASAQAAQDRRPAEQQRAAPSVPDTAREADGLIREPAAIERIILFADRHFGGTNSSNGLYLDFNNMVPGAGWIAGGPGYRRWFNRDALMVEGSAAVSWHAFKTAQAQFQLPKLASGRLAIGSQFKWQDFPQVEYFGEGPSSSELNRSEYRLRSTDIVGTITYQPQRWLDVGARYGVLQPSVLPRGGRFMSSEPDTRDVFGSDIVYALPEQPAFTHADAFVAADTRDFPNHPTRGTVLHAAARNYSDRDTGLFSFNQYEIGGAQFVPISDGRVVVGARARLVASDPGDDGYVPFYLQPSLGGHNSLRSFPDYRFHDRNALQFNLETRVAMMRHVDAAFFIDAGNVATRVQDLNLEKRSYGAGLRLHSRQQTFARLDVANGQEGWRVVFRLTEPLNLLRFMNPAANVPFVP